MLSTRHGYNHCYRQKIKETENTKSRVQLLQVCLVAVLLLQDECWIS